MSLNKGSHPRKHKAVVEAEGQMSRGSRFKPSKYTQYERMREAIEYLMESGGLVMGSKKDFALLMATRHGKVWLRPDGTPNAAIVADICNLTRDQAQDGIAASIAAGFVISYSPSIGGLALFDPDGDISFDSLLHMLAGDMHKQQSSKTMNRRRVSYWNAGGHQAMKNGEADLARVMFQIEREIDSQGLASDTLVAEFLRIVEPRAGVSA